MVELNRQGAVDVLYIDQPLGMEEAERLAQAVGACLSGGQPMAVLDLRAAPLVDSAGLECLLDLQETFVRRGGVLKLAGANELCRDVLRITGVGERFEMFDDVESAVGSFAK